MRFQALLRKDFRLHMANSECFLSNVLLSICLLILIRFFYSSDNLEPIRAGAYWLTFFISGNMTLNRIVQLENDNNCADGLIISGVAAHQVFFSRLASNILFFLLTQSIVIPIHWILFAENTDWNFFGFLPVFLGVLLGYVAIMGFIASLLVEIRFSEILLPIIGLPVQIPILLAGIVLSERLYTHIEFADSLNWYYLILVFDAVFIGLVYILNVLIYE